MKRILLSLALAASLAANAYLILRPSDSASPRAVISDTKSEAIPATPAIFTLSDWHDLQAGEPEAISRFKRLGLSLDFINDILRSQIEAQFAERERAVLAQEHQAPYWSSRYDNIGRTNRNYTELQKLRREKEATLKSILGDDYRDTSLADNIYSSFLPVEKAIQLQRLSEDYLALTQPLRNYTGITFPEDREKLAFLETQRRADTAGLLTADELRAYDLRNSSTASGLKFNLVAFKPSEQEFLTIYEAQKIVDEQFPREKRSNSSDDRAALAAAQKSADEKIRAALGDERFADYERSKDYNYLQLHNLGERLQIPAAQIIAAHDYAKTLDTRRNEIRTSKSTLPERLAQIDTLTAEATQKLTGYLGEKGYAAYSSTSIQLRNLQLLAETLRKIPTSPTRPPTSPPSK